MWTSRARQHGGLTLTACQLQDVQEKSAQQLLAPSLAEETGALLCWSGCNVV